MGIKSQALGLNKGKKKFGQRPSKGDFGKKKSYIKKKSVKKLATTDELDYLQWMKDMDFPCFVCGGHFKNQNHHLRFDETDRLHTSNGKKDHRLLVPVCYEHHFGKVASFHGNKYGLAKRFTKESLTTISEMYYERYLEMKGIWMGVATADTDIVSDYFICVNSENYQKSDLTNMLNHILSFQRQANEWSRNKVVNVDDILSIAKQFNIPCDPQGLNFITGERSV